MENDQEFAKSIWCLLVSLKERVGDETVYNDPWYGQDFIRVENECKKILNVK